MARFPRNFHLRSLMLVMLATGSPGVVRPGQSDVESRPWSTAGLEASSESSPAVGSAGGTPVGLAGVAPAGGAGASSGTPAGTSPAGQAGANGGHRFGVTPATSLALTTGGWAAVILGTVGVGVTAIQYDEEMSSADFARARALNTASWALLAVGGGAVLAQALLPPRVPPPRRGVSIGLRPTGIDVAGRF